MSSNPLNSCFLLLLQQSVCTEICWLVRRWFADRKMLRHGMLQILNWSSTVCWFFQVFGTGTCWVSDGMIASCRVARWRRGTDCVVSQRRWMMLFYFIFVRRSIFPLRSSLWSDLFPLVWGVALELRCLYMFQSSGSKLPVVFRVSRRTWCWTCAIFKVGRLLGVLRGVGWSSTVPAILPQNQISTIYAYNNIKLALVVRQRTSTIGIWWTVFRIIAIRLLPFHVVVALLHLAAVHDHVLVLSPAKNQPFGLIFSVYNLYHTLTWLHNLRRWYSVLLRSSSCI